MSTAALPRGRSSRALEGGAWVGLIAGLLLVASVLCLPGHRAYAAGPPAFGPKDLTDWAQAVAGSIGLLTAACNGVAIIWHRWGKRPRKSKRRDVAARPEVRPHGE